MVALLGVVKSRRWGQVEEVGWWERVFGELDLALPLPVFPSLSFLFMMR
jgi:hypothetical protein